MTSIALILLARAIHIFSGVTWAGSMFLLTWVIFPIGREHAAEGAGRWVATIARRAGPVTGVSAVLTLLSGIYLMLVLHPDDKSVSGIVLQAGALAAILSLFTGIFIGRPAGQKLMQLMQQQSSTPSAAELAEREALRKRSAFGSGLTAILLVLAVLAMATFRYVQALA